MFGSRHLTGAVLVAGSLLLAACEGDTGPAGAAGAAGAAGPAGATGPQGEAGADATAEVFVGPFFEDNDQILTDPMLTGPTADGVVVVWYSSLADAEHEVVYGDALDQRASAQTTRMTQLFEDSGSSIAGLPEAAPAAGEAVEDRAVYRHAARVTGLDADRRVPYYAITRVGDAEFRSRVFTLQPLPSPDRPVKLLLTSDQQNRAMSPANFEKVVETVGRVDAVLFAVDYVDTPNRASEWFDRDDESRPAFFPVLQGRFQELFPQHPYRGGEILQHAPIFGTIGNHESPGRFDRTANLNFQDNEPRPRWFAAWQWDQLDAAAQAATGMTREEFIRARSFDHVTYYEMWDLPENEVAEEDPENYYALRYGNVSLISMNVSRVWRNWNNGFANDGRGKFAEPAGTVNDLDTWGFGDMFFGDYGPGSDQRAWLAEQLASDDFTGADYHVVLTHQTMFGHGDNAVPVMANPEATITFLDARDPVVTTFPADEATWTAIVEAAQNGLIDTVRYRYARDADLWLGVEAELLEAGVDLVHVGHSHTWNRTFVELPDASHRMHYLETSNVGNTFGPTVNFNPRVPWATQFYPDPATNDTRDNTFWPPEDYPRFGDPQGRPDVAPSRVAQGIDVMRDIESGPEGMPFISSNRITVFSILDSGDGTVRSYAHDTLFPRAPAVEVDCFPLTTAPDPDPCAL
ncbi:MAG: hypothetical protein V2J02_11705 [Pseudomonadales bacterium]|nr:hypothetical protein [Pseudomonadales bacterium]